MSHAVDTIPSRIGPYVFKGVIGTGSFAVVKLAQNTLTKEYFACKIVNRQQLEKNEACDRFELEIHVSRQLHHPNIVSLSEILKDALHFYVFILPERRTFPIHSR